MNKLKKEDSVTYEEPLAEIQEPQPEEAAIYCWHCNVNLERSNYLDHVASPSHNQMLGKSRSIFEQIDQVLTDIGQMQAKKKVLPKP